MPPPPQACPDAQVQVNKLLQSKENLQVEILLVLLSVQNHFSFKSNDNISQLFKTMFWDSNIVKAYSCGKTKPSYMIAFRLAATNDETIS